MKKCKKLLSLLLAVSMLTACVAGCGNEQTSGKNETSEVESTVTSESETQVVEETPLYNVGSLPIVNEKITLKVLTVDHTGKAWETADKSGFWALLEEKTGIHFEVESYAKEELKSKLSLIMATPEEMPDIFLYTDFSSMDVQQYGERGQLLMMDEYIEKYAPNAKEIFDTIDGALGAARSTDGHIYSLPYIIDSVNASIYVLNSRFMENSGLDSEKDVPTTIEELYEVFKAIQKADANGDGIVGNEICWSTDLKNFKRTAFAMVGIPCYSTYQGCIFDQKNDEVYFVPTSEEYKYLLSWLHKIYEEGMLDQEIFTQTAEQRKAKLNSDLVFMSHTYFDPEKTDFNGITGAFFLDAPLTSAVSDEYVVPLSSYVSANIAEISAYTEYPEVCMLLLDYFYSVEGSKLAVYGVEGVDYIVDELGQGITASTDWTYRNGPNTMPVNYWRRDESNPSTITIKTTLQKGSSAFCKAGGKVPFQEYLKFTSEQADTLATFTADLGLYCDDYFVGVITGNYDLEKTWDEYVKKCEGMQLDKITEIYQDAYNLYVGIK